MAYFRYGQICHLKTGLLEKSDTLQCHFAVTDDLMMERGHFLNDMQKTGPKLAIFHGFFGQNVKKSGLLD